MPKIVEMPKALRPYKFHGLDIEVNGSEGRADCPFCDKEKWYVATDTGLWDCKVCGLKGNVYTFLGLLWNKSFTRPGVDYSPLSTHRRLKIETLKAWGVAKSLTTNDWILPGYAPNGNINQLYRYSGVNGKSILYATHELEHQLFGVPLLDKKKADIYVCEGPWDGMALWETLRRLKRNEDGGLVATANVGVSLLTNIVATPGANAFKKSWAGLFAGRHVYFLGDNDHPRPVNGHTVPGASLLGVQRAVDILGKADNKPEAVYYLNWGENGEGYTKDLPTGYDVRDHLTLNDSGKLIVTAVDRIPRVADLLTRIHPIPEAWVNGRTKEAATQGRLELECLPCVDWRTLTMSWRVAMQWTEGLDRALSVMLATILSTPAVGDQLWMRIIGPASCGKSTLCEAISVNKKYVKPVSTVRGFHSGYQTDDGGREDNSLLSKCLDMTVVTKDGDTLLQSPNLGQILSEGRDLYDGTSRTSYRNKASRNYERIRMTWILCGTSSLLQLDTSELGERFLTCRIMEGIDELIETSILERTAHKALANLGYVGGKDSSSQNGPELTRAMCLTGGYVQYLRDHAMDLLARVSMPPSSLARCIDLAQFVAYMRARPSTRQDETAERELASRLTSQMVRLAMCTAAVLNRKTVDEEVLRRCTRVAMDSSHGKVLDLVKLIYHEGEDGIETKSLCHRLHKEEKVLSPLLVFMKAISVLEVYHKEMMRNIKGLPRWRVTGKIRGLYERVYDNERTTTPDE